MLAHEIVGHVLKRFYGLPVRMVRLFGKSSEWWSSHGRTPKKLDEHGTGNIGPVDPYMELCERYDAAAPGAGKLLNEMVYAELRFRFSESQTIGYAQNKIRRDLLREATEAVSALDEKDIRDADTNDLRRWDKEISDLVGMAYEAQDVIRGQIRQLQAGN